jgi:alkylation response protein AidB-like acyl-CoA dehydrogenase
VDLALSYEQTLLAEAAAELAARGATWDQLVEFGALDVGDGIGAVELTLVARSLGGELAALPFAETAALNYVAGGTGRAALCVEGPGRTRSGRSPLTGIWDGISFAATADRIAVASGGAILVVDPAAGGIEIEPQPGLDPSLEAARVRFEEITATEVEGDPHRLAAVAGVLVSADAVGAAAKLLELASEYAGQRRQFGQTIGSFQAIRHLLADMYVDVESSWSSVLYAAAALDEEEPDSLRTASIAKAYTARATLAVAHGALQVFGGIAFTAEHPAHRYLRRIAVRGEQFGSARDHERSLGRRLAARSPVAV